MAFSARKFGKSFAWTVGILGVAGLSGALGVLAVVYGMVYFGDDSALKKSTILARINEETNIYMLDGETQIGSFFDSAHRRYVPIDEIPADMINALIAAEDKNFYQHVGIDVPAIFSAGIDYLRTGRMRGASTLTQQTVRNILGWWEVSLSRKFREWIAALQIERLYSKRQILEFYLNQFYVSGNGNGVGIAAKYYFNKEVRELSLVESAFIAGSVKGPSAYDPFIKFTREKREKAIENAFHRKNYVLRRMLEQGWITEERFKEAWDEPVKFNRGRFRSDEVALVHLIREQMKRKEILDVLHIDDPRELANAGFKIFTTIDPDMQVGAQQAVRRNLSRLETILSGFAPEKPELFKKLRSLTVNDFYFGQVLEKTAGKEPSLKLTFGDLPHCTVPYDSLMRYAKWLDLPTGRTWQKELDGMMKKINIGDVLYVEVKEYHPETHDGVCELNKRPRINGGMVALDKGEVRAVVSGFDTKGFNRAIYAKRQPGSVFKPLVYFAAMQLGWSVLDRLDNERQVFPYQGQFYYPRPDHDSPYRETSMLWAGVMSENLASVALTQRLVEKLNYEQFKQLLGVMELSPLPGELPRDFHYRVARATGVQLDNEGVKEFQLRNAVADLLLDIQYTTTYEYQQTLEKMWWGRGYAAEINNVLLNDDTSAQFKATKIGLLNNNFARFGILDSQLIGDWAMIQSVVTQKGAEEAFADPAVQKALGRFRVLPGLSKPGLGYFSIQDNERPTKNYDDKAEIERLTHPAGRPLNAIDLQAIWAGSALFGSAEIGLNDVQLNGWLQHGHYMLLSGYLENHYAEVMGRQEEYDLHRYWQHHDFRIAVGLQFLVKLSKEMGITSKLEPVLSFPLGTNVVSVAEVAKAYQTFINGKTYRFFEEGPPNQINFIKRIEDRYGNVLLEPKAKEHQLVAREFAVQMREILYRIVTHGTGRKARSELFLTLDQPADKNKKSASKIVRIPAFGKTGTTNDYTNANFAGFMPYPVSKGDPLDPENSYVLAAYVGYDYNKTMQNGLIKVSGSQGALPAWIGLAKEIIDKKKYIDQIDPLDINLAQRQEWAMTYDQRTTPVGVDMPRGVVLDRGSGSVDQESIALADSAVEGESRFDEFRANVVQTTVRIPLDSGGTALRMFAPFKPEDPEAKGEFPSASKITTQGVSVSRNSQPKDVRYYDDSGNRVDEATAPEQQGQPAPAPAPAKNPPQPAGQQPATSAAPAASVPQNPAPQGEPAPQEEPQEPQDWESVNPDDVFKDLNKAPPAKQGEKKEDPAAPKEGEEGFVEEELW
jgi:membrane peptidoglycan carboxypeptidase